MHERTTKGIVHWRDSGMPAAVSRSFSCPYPDSESHANPYVTCNFPLWVIADIL